MANVANPNPASAAAVRPSASRCAIWLPACENATTNTRSNSSSSGVATRCSWCGVAPDHPSHTMAANGLLDQLTHRLLPIYAGTIGIVPRRHESGWAIRRAGARREAGRDEPGDRPSVGHRARLSLRSVGVDLEVGDVEPLLLSRGVDDLHAVADLAEGGVGLEHARLGGMVGERLDVQLTRGLRRHRHERDDLVVLVRPQLPLGAIDGDRLLQLTGGPLPVVLGPDHQLGGAGTVAHPVDPHVVGEVPRARLRGFVRELRGNALEAVEA